MTDKWILLFKLLLERTRNGNLSWSETADDEAYLASIGKNKILYERDGRVSGNYFVHIMSNAGKVVDSFDTGDLGQLTNEDWSPEGEELFNLIRRKISGADEVLDDILSELNDSLW
tara:strand:- start:28 stop:375 length:348 start_codon:yes stop_codon:yes gene_type:complete